MASFLMGIFSIITKKHVSIDQAYTDKKSVALYIYTYNDLPKNYLTKAGAQYQFGEEQSALNHGYSIGGDSFHYQGTITQFTKQTSLKEADIYSNLDERLYESNRGTERLVFTHNTKKIEVFYTADHYKNFTKISYTEIQLVSTVFQWLGIAFFLFFVILCIIFYYKKILEFAKNLKNHQRIFREFL